MNTDRTAPGRPCPAWCAGLDEHPTEVHRDVRGALHTSAPVDAWTTEGSDGAPLLVALDGFTRTTATATGEDWTHVRLTGADSLGQRMDAALTSTDARRLAAALTLTADMAEGTPQK